MIDRGEAVASERAATVERAAALARQVEELADEQANTTHDDEHDPEGVTIGYQRAQLQGLLADAYRDLGALDRAAERLREGRYGRCAGCGSPVAPARLEALPATETCIGCAGKLLPRDRRA